VPFELSVIDTGPAIWGDFLPSVSGVGQIPRCTLAELTNLKELQLQNTPVSDEQVQKLRQALPNCKIDK
jgi:hypothetical protein